MRRPIPAKQNYKWNENKLWVVSYDSDKKWHRKIRCAEVAATAECCKMHRIVILNECQSIHLIKLLLFIFSIANPNPNIWNDKLDVMFCSLFNQKSFPLVSLADNSGKTESILCFEFYEMYLLMTKIPGIGQPIYKHYMPLRMPRIDK